MAKGVAIVSGGMDSVTLAHMLAEKDDLTLVSFDYGQKHKKELEFASECAKDLSAAWYVVDLSQFGSLLRSALTEDSIDVPEGHYAEDSMKATVVPNRNAIMINMAAGIAVSQEADYVATGVHAGDHFVYPDCRPGFIYHQEAVLKEANEGFIREGFQVQAPFVHMTKDQIVTVGSKLSSPVDYSKTWSCYKGGTKHCGKCGTCVERKEAFELAGVDDPTVYDA